MRLGRFIQWGALVLLILFVNSCTAGYTSILGYVYDITTAAPLKDFKMQIDSPELGSKTTGPDGNGMFQFTIKSNSDYVVRITQDGYRTFTSTNLRVFDLNVGTDNVIYRRIYMAAMVPSTISHAEVTGTVVDMGDGTPIDGGFYRMSPTGISAGFQSQVFSSGIDSGGNLNPRFWMPDTGTVAGPITKGAFTIPKDTMLPGYTYTIAIVGVPGYQDKTTAFPAFSTVSLNTVPQIGIKLAKLAQPGAVALMTQSYLGPDGVTPVPIAASRKLVYTFDRPVTADLTGLKGRGSNTLLTVNPTVDNNGNGTTTSTTLATETVGANAFSSNVLVASSGNQVTITLAADATLISGTIDTGDDLAYTLAAALTGNIKVRDAAWSGAPWSSLGSFGALVTTIQIRHNFAP